MKKEELMLRAIDEARSGMKAGHGGPFGAVVARDGEVVSAAHNTVLLDNDPTKHAEMRAISAAAKKLGTYDLSGCEIYSTTEPCPMCFSAIHWARIGLVVYGTCIGDAAKRGFNELAIAARDMKSMGSSPVDISGGFMLRECSALLEEWDGLLGKKVY